MTDSTQTSTSEFDLLEEESLAGRQARINEHLRYIHEHPGIPLSVDTETSDREFRGPMGLRVDDGRAKCIGVSVAYRREVPSFGNQLESFYIAVDHWVGENDSERTVARLKAVLLEPHPLIFANVQFDWLALMTIGIDVRFQPFYDIMTMAQMINENWPKKKSLDNLAVEYLPDNARKVAVWPWEAKHKLKTEKVTGWPNTTPFMMDEYARVDTELTYRVWETMLKDRRWRELPPAIWEHKQKFTRLLVKMRLRGIKLDIARTKKWMDEGVARMKEINDSLGLDLNKPGDIKELFLERLALPVVKRTKTGAASFDRFAMEIYLEMLEADGRPEAQLFTEYQGWKTAVGLLYRSWLEKVSPDGRLRTEFITHETVTGRLSSRNPNLQQVPRESTKYWNGTAKECFLFEEGYTGINADFSQLELRVATGYAKEPVLLETFASGEDVFAAMTVQFRDRLAGRNPRVAEKWDRNNTKVLVYRLQYGGGYKSLMNAYAIQEEPAKELLYNYRDAFPRFQQLNRAITLKAEADGQVKTWSGRIRHMQYDSDSYKAMNSVIQGGSADIVERVMLRLEEEIDDEEKCRILLTVHDSVVFEIRNDLVEEYMPRIQAIMSDVDAVTAPDSFGVVFAVEVERWHYSE